MVVEIDLTIGALASVLSILHHSNSTRRQHYYSRLLISVVINASSRNYIHFGLGSEQSIFMSSTTTKWRRKVKEINQIVKRQLHRRSDRTVCSTRTHSS